MQAHDLAPPASARVCWIFTAFEQPLVDHLVQQRVAATAQVHHLPDASAATLRGNGVPKLCSPS
jgi:hypothetical protein